MTCADARPFLGAHVDNELDLRTSVDIAVHVRSCGACTARVAELRALHEAAKSHLARFAPSAAVEARLRGAVRPPRRSRWAALAGGATAMAVAAVIALFVIVRPPDRVRDEVVAAHARSMLADHATDVASSDQHTVKPWFQGKLDFGVPVTNPADAGFPLVGGRLDLVDGRQVAALVYRRRNHLINAFVWPQPSESAPVEHSERGFAILSWARGGLAWWLVSDAAPADLRELASLLGDAH
jgi:anti-sigma factor RsiW